MTEVICGECGALYALASAFELEGPCRECGEEALVEADAYDSPPTTLICVDCRREIDGGPAGDADDEDFAGRHSVEDPCPLCGGEMVPLEQAPARRPEPEAALARAAARRVRSRHGVAGPWIDIERVVEVEGLRIVRRTGIEEPRLVDEETIEVPAGARRSVERFGLAHELGHRELRHRVPESQLEIEANAFAAELLMPLREVRRLVAAGQSIAALARNFEVSREAITRTLTGAGLINEVSL
jgi:hypothetical protein